MKYLAIFFALFLFFVGCKEKEKPNKEEPKQETMAVDTQVVEEPEVAVSLPTIDQVMGRFNPAQDSNFVHIETIYTDKPWIYLQKEAYDKFVEMHDAAKQGGIELFIISATRPFDYQRNIWERKWQQQLDRGLTDEVQIVREILKYSAMPGTSRHHWGTDIDLNYLNNSAFESGNGQEIYQWLLAHAAEYGFCQPYTAKNDQRPHGYEEEKWHWSYLPIADLYFQSAKLGLKDELITGFSGATHAVDLDVVENYVFGIDPACY